MRRWNRTTMPTLPSWSKIWTRLKRTASPSATI
nr:MAG TPA: hypothetical protein [Caudoviricetes sp.]